MSRLEGFMVQVADQVGHHHGRPSGPKVVTYITRNADGTDNVTTEWTGATVDYRTKRPFQTERRREESAVIDVVVEMSIQATEPVKDARLTVDGERWTIFERERQAASWRVGAILRTSDPARGDTYRLTSGIPDTSAAT